MTVIDDLLLSLPADVQDTPTRDVVVGLYWTAVYGQRVGLAATLDNPSCCFSSDVAGVGQLHNQKVIDLAERLRSTHLLDVAVGMAALNALIPVDEQDNRDINARDLILEHGRNKTVVTVGHFPFTDALREMAARLWVLELNPTPGDHPAEAAPELIPQADVIGLTASTLLNGTFESLTKLFPPQALVVMLGPSTPMSRVLFDYGVTMLGGVLVTEPETALRYVSQGSSLHHVPGIRRVTLMKP
ncbi:MAG: DUF364 domain-containing protein [Anaerolineae bacterium]|nr:DUF364 domain-containing protein [Anaerolineae bacterium]